MSRGRCLAVSWGVLGGFWGSWWPSGTGFIFFHGLLGASWGRPAAVLDPLGPSPDRFGEVLEALGARRRRQKQMAGRNEKCTFCHCKTYDFEDEGSLRERLGALFGAFFGRPGAPFEKKAHPGDLDAVFSPSWPLFGHPFCARTAPGGPSKIFAAAPGGSKPPLGGAGRSEMRGWWGYAWPCGRQDLARSGTSNLEHALATLPAGRVPADCQRLRRSPPAPTILPK